VNDQLVEYFKPSNKPDWLNDEQWKQVAGVDHGPRDPPHCQTPRLQAITVTIVTTLLDPEQYPPKS